VCERERERPERERAQLTLLASSKLLTLLKEEEQEPPTPNGGGQVVATGREEEPTEGKVEVGPRCPLCANIARRRHLLTSLAAEHRSRRKG